MTMIGTEQMDDFPYPDGRFVFNKKEILTAILAALEKWYISSDTPRDKRLGVTGTGIAKHVCYGTFRNSVRLEDQESYDKLRKRIFRWLSTFATEKKGKNTWLFTPEAIDELRKEIGLEPPSATEIKTEPVPGPEQEKDSMIINLSDFVKTVKAYKCIVCERIFTRESDLLLHFRKNKLSEFMEES